MSLQRDTPLISQGDFTAEQISRAFAHYGNDPGNIGAVIVDAAHAIGLNSDFLACQIADESGWWTSKYAMERNNPSGFGAVDNNPDLAYTFASVTEGVRVTVAHWGTYILGDTNPLIGEDSRARWVRPGWRGTIKTLGMIGSGVWASADDYAQAVLNRYDELVQVAGGNEPSQPKGGSMEPDRQYSVEPPVQCQLQNNAHSFIDRPTNPDGRILAIVKHVTDGENLEGALSWNRNPSVQASAHFYIDRDGTVVQDVSLNNGAWANGVLDNPTLPPQFDEVVAKGWNPNDFTVSIEHVGKPDDEDFPTDAQLKSDARLTADLCDHYDVPVDEDHIIGHYRFDGVNRAHCPGPHWDFTADVQRVNDLLNGDGNVIPKPDANGGTTSPVNPKPDGGTGGMAGTVDATGTGGDGSITRDENGNVRYVYFKRTGQSIGGGFGEYYRANGFNGDKPASELDVSPAYGFPITGEYTATVATIRGGQPTVVQWFERARFEWVVDNAETGAGHVELGRVGVEAMESLPPSVIPGNAWRG